MPTAAHSPMARPVPSRRYKRASTAFHPAMLRGTTSATRWVASASPSPHRTENHPHRAARSSPGGIRSVSGCSETNSRHNKVTKATIIAAPGRAP